MFYLYYFLNQKCHSSKLYKIYVIRVQKGLIYEDGKFSLTLNNIMLLFSRKLILREGFVIETEVAINVSAEGSQWNEMTGFSSDNIYRFFYTREIITPSPVQWHAREDIGGANIRRSSW